MYVGLNVASQSDFGMQITCSSSEVKVVMIQCRNDVLSDSVMWLAQAPMCQNLFTSGYNLKRSS